MSAYHVSRNRQQLGVYPESDARDYFSQGRIVPDDLVWTEGMPEWLPAGQVFGSGMPAVEPVAPSLPAATPVPKAPQHAAPAAAGGAAPVPLPPSLHWALVLLLTVLTLGLFYAIWMFVQAAWIKRINPASNATGLLAIYVVLALAGQVMVEASGDGSNGATVGLLLVVAATVVSIFAFFSMRRSMLDYYSRVEPIDLRLSAALTFLLSVFYLQYHMTRIVRWKKSGVLPL